MRIPDEPDFPFAALATVVDRARARCAALRERPWAVEVPVQAAAEAFGGRPTAAHWADLVDALQAAGCADRAILGALAPDAGAGDGRTAARSGARQPGTSPVRPRGTAPAAALLRPRLPARGARGPA